MPVSRIEAESLNKIMSGGITDEGTTTVVVKFYSNGCHYCHALSDYYIDLSEQDNYDNIYFFAFNVDDTPEVAEKLSLNGVPSIALFQTRNGSCIKTRVMEDPDNPHDKTWYTIKQIKNFIDREV